MLRLVAAVSLLALPAAAIPGNCPATTPGPDDSKNCSLTVPSGNDTDAEVFAEICKPGALGHAGGAEPATGRCPQMKYEDGVFKCACCGAPLFYAVQKYPGPQGDGWPAFYGNDSSGNSSVVGQAAGAVGNVCVPAGGYTEVVCAKCGAHLGDFFLAGTNGNDDDYYCIDGVCLLPPGAAPGAVCQGPSPPPPASKQAALRAMRSLMREKGAAVLAHAH